MRWLRYMAIAVITVLIAWFIVLRGIPAWQARPIRPTMDAYLRAAGTQDSMALERISISSSPVHWALTVQRQVPAFIAGARSAHPEWVSRRQDTIVVSFRLSRAVPDPVCPYRALDNIQARFIERADGTWRIIRAAVPAC